MLVELAPVLPRITSSPYPCVIDIGIYKRISYMICRQPSGQRPSPPSLLLIQATAGIETPRRSLFSTKMEIDHVQ